MKKTVSPKALSIKSNLLLTFIWLTLLICPTISVAKEKVILNSWVVNFADTIEIWRFLGEDLKKVGINVDLKTGTLNEFVGEIVKKKHDYHLVTIVWGAGPERLEPTFFLNELFHSERAKPGGRNYGYFRNEEYDSVVEKQLTEMDPIKRKALVFKAQELIHKNNAFFPICHRDYIQVYDEKRIADVVPVMGTGIGYPYIPWTFYKARTIADIEEPRIVGKNDLLTLNPFAVSQVQNESWLRMVYDTLAFRDKDAKLIPWAAESWEIVDDKTVNIILRKGMKFQDGKPVTVDDVKFTFDFIKEWEFPAFTDVWQIVDNVKILDDSKLRVELKTPYAPFAASILLKTFIAPKHIWADVTKKAKVSNPQEWNNPEPIGSGPYRFDEWKKGEYFHLIANKEHFVKPEFKGLYYVIVPAKENQYAMMEKRQAEIIGWSMDMKQAKKLAEFDHLKMVSVSGHGMHEMRPNMDKKPMSDPAFRKALQHCIDRKKIG